MLGFISIPTDFVSNVGTYAATILADMSPVAVLLIGVLLGLMILGWLIDRLKGRSRTPIDAEVDDEDY
jgi:divalent metal cation (Fe/Co/Zn/Cd) transporter